jgi:transposase
MQHPNARLTPRGRHELVQLVERGASLRLAAAACNVALSTAHRWVVRWRAASSAERASLACLRDRSSRPHRSPRLLADEIQRRVVEARAQTGWGPRLLAGPLGLAHQTVWKVLHRHGCSRPQRPVREAANRYEWPCPGELLHMDVSRYARFERPGHARTGDRSQAERNWMRPETRVGFDYAHALVDDHSRLAYVELLADERAATVTSFVERALAFYERHGITTKRVLTDNAYAYARNRSLRELLEARGISHRRTRPYRPRTNGKVERFHQTMARE